MSGSFWLKSALDLILAVLKEDDPIMLAPNSAQAPPLLPGTRTNVFNPSQQQQQQTAPQQQPAATDPQQLQQQTGAEAAATAADQVTAADAGDQADAVQQQQQQAAAAQDGPAPMAVDSPQPANLAAADAAAAHQKQRQELQAQPSAAQLQHLPPQGSQGVQAIHLQQQQQQRPGIHSQQGGVPNVKQEAEPQAMCIDGDAAGGAAAFPVAVRESDVPCSIKALLEGHLDFLAAAGQLSVRDMMGPLREYAQVDPYVAYHLWVLVFPIVWATLAKQQQINLAKPIISLLSKEYHQRQAMARPNVVQVGGQAGRRTRADATPQPGSMCMMNSSGRSCELKYCPRGNAVCKPRLQHKTCCPTVRYGLHAPFLDAADQLLSAQLGPRVAAPLPRAACPALLPARRCLRASA